MAFYEKFPYTNFQELNLDELIQRVLEVEKELQFVIDNASLKYADPIQWDITHQYQVNTVVIDPATGIAYISTHPVPSNILITDTDYWTPVFDLSPLFNEILNKPYTTPEDHGAIGDGVADDTQALQDAVNSGKMVLGLSQTAVYKTTDTVRITGDNKNVYISGKITYNGNGSAVQIEGTDHRVYINTISAINGTGVDFYQVDPNLNTAYCELKTDTIHAQYGITFSPTSHGIQNCYIYPGHVIADIDAVKINGGMSQDPSIPSYVGEVVFYNGRLRGTAGYAVHLDCGAGFEINKTSFNNVSFEGSLNGVRLDAGSGRIVGANFLNCRIDEITGKVISINGNVRDGYFKSAVPFSASRIESTSTAPLTRGFTIDNDLYSGNGVKCISKAYVCTHGVLMTADWYRKTVSADYIYDPSANDYCCAFFTSSAAGTFTITLPYLSAHSMNEFIVSQTANDRHLIVKDCEGLTAFDGTNRGQGVYLVRCFRTATSSSYTTFTI